MAFLLWNFPPAKLRLGSVGSLFLAGMLGCVPLCIGWPDLTPVSYTHLDVYKRQGSFGVGLHRPPPGAFLRRGSAVPSVRPRGLPGPRRYPLVFRQRHLQRLRPLPGQCRLWPCLLPFHRSHLLRRVFRCV